MSTTSTGGVDRGAGNRCGAALKTRTNIANRGRSSGQGGKGLGGVVCLGAKASSAVSTALTT
eukprot:scaffold8568_cov104-Amphora_coffeaeformis.AAC.1